MNEEFPSGDEGEHLVLNQGGGFIVSNSSNQVPPAIAHTQSNSTGMMNFPHDTSSLFTTVKPEPGEAARPIGDAESGMESTSSQPSVGTVSSLFQMPLPMLPRTPGQPVERITVAQPLVTATCRFRTRTDERAVPVKISFNNREHIFWIDLTMAQRCASFRLNDHAPTDDSGNLVPLVGGSVKPAHFEEFLSALCGDDPIDLDNVTVNLRLAIHFSCDTIKEHCERVIVKYLGKTAQPDRALIGKLLTTTYRLDPSERLWIFYKLVAYSAQFGLQFVQGFYDEDIQQLLVLAIDLYDRNLTAAGNLEKFIRKVEEGQEEEESLQDGQIKSEIDIIVIGENDENERAAENEFARPEMPSASQLMEREQLVQRNMIRKPTPVPPPLNRQAASTSTVMARETRVPSNKVRNSTPVPPPLKSQTGSHVSGDQPTPTLTAHSYASRAPRQNARPTLLPTFEADVFPSDLPGFEDRSDALMLTEIEELNRREEQRLEGELDVSRAGSSTGNGRRRLAPAARYSPGPDSDAHATPVKRGRGRPRKNK